MRQQFFRQVGRQSFATAPGRDYLFTGYVSHNPSVPYGRANVFLNGKAISFARTASAVGLSFSRSGRVTPLPPLQRPCV